MHVVAIDLGGTFTKVARAAEDGSLSDVEELDTPVVDGVVPPQWLAQVVADRSEGARGWGVAVPGIVADGRVQAASNIGWYDLDLATLITDATGLPGAVG